MLDGGHHPSPGLTWINLLLPVQQFQIVDEPNGILFISPGPVLPQTKNPHHPKDVVPGTGLPPEASTEADCCRKYFRDCTWGDRGSSGLDVHRALKIKQNSFI